MSVTQLKQRLEKQRPPVPEIPPQTAKPPPARRGLGYPAEFRHNAIRMVKEQKLPISAAARKLDIAYETLSRWIYKHDADRAHAATASERKERASERRQHMCEAIALLKQAIDLMHAACHSAHSKQEKPT